MASLQYDPSLFPKARAPALPTPSPECFCLLPQPIAPGVLALTEVRHLHSGRYALSLALKQKKIGPGDHVLLPAYHCLAMVEPLRLAGVEPIYYPVGPNLSLDIAAIEQRAAHVKAIIAVHYFGFPQDFRPLRNLADRLGLILIEDCAHACFGAVNGLPVGSLGDYAIASTMKFFPIGHGGVLASSRHPLVQPALKNPPLKIELKTAINLLEDAQIYQRLGRLGRLIDILIQLKNRLQRLTQRSQPLVPDHVDATLQSTPEYAMDSRWLEWRSSRVSRFLLRHTRIDHLIERRRHYYRIFLDAVANRTDCRPLFPELPEGVVPQVFPLYVNQCLPVFVNLKRQGVPIIRFGEFLDDPVDRDLCPVSVDYAEHVLQFPCHQTLREDEVAWIVERLIFALDAAKNG